MTDRRGSSKLKMSIQDIKIMYSPPPPKKKKKKKKKPQKRRVV